MALKDSGTISLNDVRVELQKPSSVISLNDSAVRSLGVKPTGTIRMSDLYGKAYGITVTLAGTLTQVNIANLVDQQISGFRKRVQINYGLPVLIKGTIGSPALDFGAVFNEVVSNTVSGSSGICISGQGGVAGVGATAGANNGSAGQQGWSCIRTRGSPFSGGAIYGACYPGGGGGGGGGGAYLSVFATTNASTSSSGIQITLRSAGGGGGGGAGGTVGSGGGGLGGRAGSGQTTGNKSNTPPTAGSDASQSRIVVNPGNAYATLEMCNPGFGGSGGYCASVGGTTQYWARGGGGGTGGDNSYSSSVSKNGKPGYAGTVSSNGSVGQGGAGGIGGEVQIGS